ncbi:CBS domain-containing protein [uncultured Corynebacterium sp.]|uniref:CBS domain-containing protein n=1 Tax=uncultured Corynebacterium sp. TaxID=159447 RepID=UPI0025CC61D4|nr:CBS domain-containing protein [uncultured Corynebacterium sp.]
MTNEVPGGNATEFLAAFNEIEAHLRRDLNAKPSDGFKWMVNLSHRKHRLSDAQRSALMAFSDLRNAISHGEYRDGRPIADPLPETVADIERLSRNLIDPPLVLNVLPERRPVTVTPEDSIEKVFAVLAESTYSQFPVYVGGVDGGECTAMLTTDAIAIWVAHDYGADGRLEAKTAADVLEWSGSRDMPFFMPRTATVQDAVSALTIPGDDGLVPRALIFTEHGKPDQKPLRVVGGADLPALWKEVQIGTY